MDAQARKLTYANVAQNVFRQPLRNTLRDFWLVKAGRAELAVQDAQIKTIRRLGHAASIAGRHDKRAILLRQAKEYGKAGLHGIARETCQEALKFAFTCQEALPVYTMMAESNERMGNWYGAAKDWEAAARVALAPDEKSRVLERQADAYVKCKEFQLAADSYEKAKECTSDRKRLAGLCIKQGGFFEMAGKEIRANIAYEKAISISQDPLQRADAYLKIMNVELKRNNLAGAVWARKRAADEIGKLPFGLEPIEK